MNDRRDRAPLIWLGLVGLLVGAAGVFFLGGDDESAVASRDLNLSTATAAPVDAADFALEPAPPESTAVPETEPTATPEPATVLELLTADPDLSAVTELIAGSQFEDILAGDVPVTFMAPSNAAIEALNPEEAAVLLDRFVESVTAYHSIAGNLSIDDLTSALDRGTRSTELETLQGESLTLSSAGAGVLLDSSALVVAEQAATNGSLLTVDAVLMPVIVELNLIVALEPIQFASANSNLEADSAETLDHIIELLEESDIEVAVHGHTDDRGDSITNQNLSQSRARSVVNYLVAGGIDDLRLSAEGFGPNVPIADNDTEEGRAANRRIEFRPR